MLRFFGDLETYNETPITHGTYRYAETAEITLFSWCLEEGPAYIWDVTEDPMPPAEMVYALRHCDEAWFWNSQFDRIILSYQMPQLCPPFHKFRCSMAQAQAASLPGKLEKVCEILGLNEDEAKMKDSRQLVLKFCKPAGKGRLIRRYDRHNSPEDWARFKDYAKQDTVALRALHRKLPSWNYPNNQTELLTWQQDQAINDRGICIDVPLVKAAIRATTTAKARMDAAVTRLAGGTDLDPWTVGQRQRILDFLKNQYDLELPDLRASTVEKLLDTVNLPPVVEQLLSARLVGSKTSNAKYSKILQAVSSDGRVRGTSNWCGAQRTGRNAGRIINPYNLPRPSLKNAAIETGIQALLGGYEETLFGDGVMELASSAIRGTIIAPPGKKLVVADLNAVEGRGGAWLTEEEWSLQAYRDYDTFLLDANGNKLRDEKGKPLRKGPDSYKMTYSKAFGVPVEEITDDQRTIGKVQELACFTGDTLIVTRRGLIPLIALDKRDEVWDGFEYVRHGGIVYRGPKRIVPVGGPRCTPDHEILLSDDSWQAAQGILDVMGAVTREPPVHARGDLHRYYINTTPVTAGGKPAEREHVYDILNCGPRNRYAVRTEEGMIIAHNCTFGGALGAFTTFQVAYGLPEFDDAEVIRIVKAWRKARPKTSSFWYESERAWREAMEYPGTVIPLRKLRVLYQKPWLLVRLPSGRFLHYANPRDNDGELSYMGVDQFTKKWKRQTTWGGKHLENYDQAMCRDILLHNLPGIEAAGYQPVLTVYDEVVAEAPDSPEFNAEHLSSLLARVPEWAPGLPLAASGFEATRYRKG